MIEITILVMILCLLSVTPVMAVIMLVDLLLSRR